MAIAVRSGSMDLPDGSLVERHLVGDEDSFEVLYRRYYERVLRLCQRQVGDRALAEDLAHDTMLKVLTKLSQFDLDRPLWPWLRVITHRVIIDHQRGQSPAPKIEERELLVERIDELPSVQERDMLVAALARIPDRQRTALGLRYVSDLDVTNAAEALGLNRAAFEQLLFRARRRLRREYLRLTETVAPKVGLVLGPVADAYRRLRLAAQRVWESANDGVLAFSLRLDPLQTLNSALATVAVTQLSVAALAGLGMAPDGEWEVVRASTTDPVVTEAVPLASEPPAANASDPRNPPAAAVPAAQRPSRPGLWEPSIETRKFEERTREDGRQEYIPFDIDIEGSGTSATFTCDPDNLQERFLYSTAACPAVETIYNVQRP